MADPYLGEIKIMAFTFAPRGYADCDGTIMNIDSNTALYSLLGVNFGGNGTNTFALPDLRGRAPMHISYGNFSLGNMGGTEDVTLVTANLPNHIHYIGTVGENANAHGPEENSLAQGIYALYHEPTNQEQFHNSAVANAGSGRPHNNMQPSLVVRFCIALTGMYPQRN